MLIKTLFGGSSLVFIVCIVTAYLFGISYVWYICIAFLTILAFIFYNKNKELQQLMQSHIVNMALLFIYRIKMFSNRKELEYKWDIWVIGLRFLKIKT